jgi:putative ABC transport system permease protein
LPVILIAAGLFAVIITGINRLSISDKSMHPSGGTGGYLLWAETSIPVKEDLTSATGLKEFGLDETPYNKMVFVEALRSQGDNASCLNLNHITSPPVLGINPASFIRKKAFSFASLIPGADKSNPWEILNRKEEDNTIYGVADQTVLEWGLKKKTGDTLKLRNESGQVLNIVIAGGLKSSLFQGYILTGEENFSKNFPSVSGYSVFLIDGEKDQSDLYTDVLNTRFENYGIDVQPARTRLATFFQVTNTYLSVFTILGGLGMILGVIGLGFVLRRNYNSRKREFALMMATGFSEKSLRKMILKEQVVMLITGIMTGLISSIVATLVSIAHGPDIPWISLAIIISGIILTGLTSLFVSVRGIRQGPLVTSLRKE